MNVDELGIEVALELEWSTPMLDWYAGIMAAQIPGEVCERFQRVVILFENLKARYLAAEELEKVLVHIPMMLRLKLLLGHFDVAVLTTRFEIRRADHEDENGGY